MATLTDRYVAATIAGVPESQRNEVDRELRASIADAVEARVDSGQSEVAAEHTVLTELGDPVRLSAAYSDRPLHLIGPTHYVIWRRVLKSLLWTVVPLVTVIVFAVRSLTAGGGPDWLAGSFASAFAAGGTTVINVAFWTTSVFAILERYPARAGHSPRGWKLEHLPVVDRKQILPEVVASIVFTVVFVCAFIWQQFAPIAFVDGEVVPEPLLAPALWTSWIPFLLVVLAASIPVCLAVYRRGGWEYWSATVKVGLDIAFAVPVAILAARGELVNDRFFSAISWPSQAPISGAGTFDPDGALVVTGIIISALGFVIVLWDAIDLGRKAHRNARSGTAPAENPATTGSPSQPTRSQLDARHPRGGRP